MNEQYIDRVFDFSFGELTISQATIGDVGCVVWDAAIVLAKYIDGPNFKEKHSLASSSILELGAGTGLVGLTAAALGGIVTLSDLETLIPLMQKNIEGNKNVLKGKCTSMVLKWYAVLWGSNLSFIYPPDIILVSDCIYYEDSLLLVNSMSQLCSEKTTIYLSYEDRNTDHKLQLVKEFFLLVNQHFFVEEIPNIMHDKIFRSDDIHIFRLSLKTI
ncbi:protein N-lysine methyltransferase METTL21D isoform X1 [Hydra vulgaris]|uniref:protein N-lysine methyltransferase METTL21D isoform X1 n=1 Tax=Hydra vulgaris TaxID=6087 RepID=UPI001F5F71FF|nr:protein N-lysine methyltransferase METTL21D isoform X1 [Hydra vulgaris]